MEVTIYEYMIHNDTFIKMEHLATQKGNSYTFCFGRNNNPIKLSMNDLEKPNRNRIFSLTDDMQFYSQALLQDLEKKIEKDKKALDMHVRQYKNLLNSIHAQ